MEKALHFRGIWFLPDNHENQVPGILEFSEIKGIDLQLLGFLGKAESIVKGDLPVISGITSDGKKITLYKCSPYLKGFNSNGLETSSYEALYMLVGLLIPEEELKFKSINIHFGDFDHWLDIYGFRKNEYHKESKETFVEYQQPADLSYLISKRCTCSFKFSTYAPSTRHIPRLTISQVCEVSLYRPNEVLPFESLFELFHTFQMFLTLSYFGRPIIKSIKLIKELESDHYGVYDKEIELYFKPDLKTDAYEAKTHSRHFLFIYDDVKENLESILCKWYEAEDSLSPTIYGLAEAFSGKNTAIEFSFLNVAHAIETLHRRRKLNSVLPINEHKERIEEILSSINPKYATWLKAKLEFSNEPTLHDRLVELISELPISIKNAVLKPSPEEFVKHFKRTRNYYTHYSPTLEKRALKGSDLFYLRERSKILLICFVLKEIGFSDSEMEKIILNKGVSLFNHIIKYDEVKEYFKSWE